MLKHVYVDSKISAAEYRMARTWQSVNLTKSYCFHQIFYCLQKSELFSGGASLSYQPRQRSAENLRTGRARAGFRGQGGQGARHPLA